MDQPILALTRSRAGASPAGAQETSIAAENMLQLVQLRWVAVGGQLLTILIVHFGLGVPLPLVPMLGVAGALALANIVSTALMARHRITNVELMLMLLLDVVALTAQLYFSGGTTNPFVSFYLLQVVLGAILLELWSAWVLVGVTGLCYAWLTAGGVPLVFPTGLVRERAELFDWGTWISFALTGTLLGLFITRITRNLRARDRYLADLRQHAAEEDAIVRMGLFASGAAHELGTPLASLSVILNDWRRVPQLAREPDLMGELREMQAEVERCKRIVTDILHSAGEPRLEAMEGLGTQAFLDDIVAAWRPTHGNVPLEYVAQGLDDAEVMIGASLRQAIWNLLDNAAEASPAGIRMRATNTDDLLTIAVADDGPGFSDEQLTAVGQPYRSSKGAGHGVGLFLAANVARRLGGRLDAANRAGGGAEVRLVLPLTQGRKGSE